MAARPAAQRTSSTNLGRGQTQRTLEGKFGIVTGGSRGIGAAVAQNLASKGCSLLLVYTSDSSTEPTKALCKEFRDHHKINAVPVQADLSDPTRSVPHIIKTAQNYFTHPRSGRFSIDVLINNAGVASNKRLNDPEAGPIGATEFDWMYKINVLAPLLLTQACAPHFPKDRSGRIVNVSSVSSSIGYEGQSVYAGTKAALEAMTRSWSRELADQCTVNAVNPGPVWGDMYSEAGESFWKVNQPYVDATPLAKYTGDEKTRILSGDPEKFDKIVREGMGGQRPAFTSEIAGVIGMLCSEEAAWTTGSVICCNGGMKMTSA